MTKLCEFFQLSTNEFYTRLRSIFCRHLSFRVTFRCLSSILSIVFLTSLASEPQLKDLVLELRHTHGWFYLGVCLGIPQSTLDQIHASYGVSLDATEICKMQLLSTWRDGSSSGCTWSAVVTALHQTGRAGLAKTIADKYGKKRLCSTLHINFIISWMV